jgi:glycosyltransferase involved in cell wall biosynthesis
MQDNPLHTSLQEAQPLVTFVVCYYDLPMQMLCQCVDSILALSLQREEREIIVVDDGSDISPTNALMQYGDDIIYVRQKHSGLSAARNMGINMARGRYLQFVDGDDRLMTEPYNHCLDILRSHEDADMVVFDFTSSTDVSTTYTDGPVLSGTDFMRHHNIHGSACLYLFRQKTLSELRFTPGIFHEDEEFTPQLLLRAEHVYPTDAHAYYYCLRPNSITSTTDEQKVQKRLDDLHAITHRLYLLADRLPLNDRLALRRRVAQLTMDYLYQIIMQTRSAQQLDTRIAMLRSEGLFPLPDEDYSQKYVWFRRMTSTALGRTLLLHSLPLLRKER